MATEHFYSESIWGATSNSVNFNSLSGDLEVDVAIVGGGITGITAAYNLSKAGKKVAVLEAGKVGMGTTGSSTGNLYSTINEHLFRVGSKFNEETMKEVALSRSAAVDFIEERVREFNIQCEFKRVPFYLFSTKESLVEDTLRSREIEKELSATKNIGLTVSGDAPAGFPFKEVDSIVNLQYQAQFNPLKYVQQFAAAIDGNNCKIFEHTKVLDITDGAPCIIRTAQGTVQAKYVIQATHSPKGVYAVHTAMEVYREQALAVRLNGPLPAPGIYWHLKAKELYSVRPYTNADGNFLIVLDYSYKVGHVEHTEKGFKKIEEYLRSHFDVNKIEFAWAAQNYKPADSLPFIGTSPLEKNIYIATGFGPDGLTYGTLASIIIADLITGKENKWAKIYDPKRFTPVASAMKFMKENIDVAAHFVADYVFKGYEKELDDIKQGEGKVVSLDGKKVAGYRDEQGKLHLVSAICTHMACVVHWNNAEKSWDCPCHGSRFSIDGKVLEGPAFFDLKKAKE